MDALVIAHRGSSAAFPENTIASVRRAVTEGADLVEVDVRLTRDGVPVLLHDETLTRTTDARQILPAHGSWRLDAHDFADVRRLDAGAWKSQPGERIPALVEIVGEANLLLDLKRPVTAALIEKLATVIPYDAGVLVQSHDLPALRHLTVLRPDLPVAALGRPHPGHLAALATWATGVHAHHLLLDRGYVARVHDHGMRCLAWTVNSRLLVDRVLRMGVDGVITDRPADVRRRVRVPV